jgi:hypothetical protein
VWLGGFFAWCARARIRLAGPWAQPALLLVASFAAILVVPATAYLYLAHPDWSWLYWVDPGRVPPIAVVPVCAAALAALTLGWWGGGRLLVRAADARVLPGALLGLLGLGVGAGFLVRARLGADGTFADFAAGRALPIFEVKLGYVLIAIAVGQAAAAAFLGWELVRDGRKAQVR